MFWGCFTYIHIYIGDTYISIAPAVFERKNKRNCGLVVVGGGEVAFDSRYTYMYKPFAVKRRTFYNNGSFFMGDKCTSMET